MRQSLNLCDQDAEHIYKLQHLLPYFCEQLLTIKVKDASSGASLQPILLNQAQKYVHDRLEQQLKKTGKVRALIVKARQFGISTYVAARYYHKTSLQEGKTAYILTHESSATTNLFDIVKRYNDYLPDVIRPELERSNQRKLRFAGTESEYFVGTAGSRHGGRSSTIHYFHGSEVSLWEQTDDIQTGVMQAISGADGSEIILESTSNGMGNLFYNMVMDALDGKIDYQVIFLPWFWHDDYESHEDTKNFTFNEEEQAIAEFFLKDYDEQKQIRKLAWRRAKIKEFRGKWKFYQEYPSTIQESFVTSGESLISAQSIMRARKCTNMDFNAPIVFGVDPARGGDRTVIVVRRGREIPMYKVYDPKNDGEMDEMRLVGILIKAIDGFKPVMVNVDVALGYGVVDRLRELGYNMVNGVHFGSKSDEPDIYANKRVEMACSLRDWLESDNISIPDCDALHADLMSVPDLRPTSDGASKLVSKQKIIESFGRSPDIFDAAMLTFAFPVKRIADNQSRFQKIRAERPVSEAKWKKKNVHS